MSLISWRELEDISDSYERKNRKKSKSEVKKKGNHHQNGKQNRRKNGDDFSIEIWDENR